MNILLAFKAEPDAGMLAEKEWQAAAQGKSGPDISLLRSLLGADEQAAAALLLAQRKNGTPMSLTALSMGDERALHWLRYLMALGFEEAVLLETAADLRFAPEFVARHIAEWQHQNPLDLIITAAKAAKGRMGKRHFCWRKCWAGPASPRWSVSLSTRCLSPSNSVLNMGCVVAGFACLR